MRFLRRRAGVAADGGVAERPAVSHLWPVWLPAYVALGSNLNEPRAQVTAAFERLAALPGTRVERRSRLYRTHPLGPQDQPDFVNAVAGLLTQLAPRDLLDRLLGIERAMGRDRQVRWGPRVIDLDLLWMVGPVIDEPALTLPHPGVPVRNFVLYPLWDIAPELVIPGVGLAAALKAGVTTDGISVLAE